jgi:hypothetical protein
VSAFCSMFSQLLKLFPRTEFQAQVKRTHAERHARGFTCWGAVRRHAVLPARPRPLTARDLRGLRARRSSVECDLSSGLVTARLALTSLTRGRPQVFG